MHPNNTNILKKRWPKLYEQLQSITPSTQVEQLQSNCIALSTNNTTQHPYGTKNASQLLNNWSTQFKLEREHCYALGGFGSGFHIQELVNKSDLSTCFFIAEKDPNQLASVLSEIDCSQLLKNPRIQLACGDLDNDFFNGLMEFPLINFKTVKPLPYTPLQVNAEDYYLEFFKQFGQNFSYLRNLHTVGINDSSFWQATTFKNLSKIINAPDVIETKNLFKGIPIVLIAAGPSLDESIDFINKISSNAIIVCVNSSYRKLINSGITPHITLAGDPRYSTYKGFKGCDTSKTILMAPSYVCPEVINAFENHILIWNTNNELLSYINKQLNRPQGTKILEKGTISLSIVDLAKLWGSSKICLVGQDMALDLNGKSHTEDSFYSDDGYFLRLSDCTYLPGNTIEKVPVHHKHIDFLKTFNELHIEYPEIEFINVSRTGAKIDHIPYKTFNEAVEWIGNQDISNSLNMLKSSIQPNTENKTSKDVINQSLDKLYQFSKRFFTMALQAIIQIDMLPSTMDNPSYANNTRIKACLSAIEDTLNYLNSHPAEQTVLLDGHTKREIYAYLKRIATIEAKTDHWQVLQQNKEYLWALASGAQFLVKQMHKSVDA